MSGKVRGLSIISLFVFVTLLSPMLVKAVPRAVARSARFFQSSASVSRVVATSPLKAEEVKVLVTAAHYHKI